MHHQDQLTELSYKTTRLVIEHIDSVIVNEQGSQVVLNKIVALLTPQVTQGLPPYFHDIETIKEAEIWLKKMSNESQLFTVSAKNTKDIIGFLFLSGADSEEVHLGYLLGDEYWHKGYGSELLSGLLDYLYQHPSIERLVGGVDKDNIASAKLLEKVGFVVKEEMDSMVVFYEYIFNHTKN
ncbi:GNAT family N-acetyltransferase [Aliivibrio fischeri]|uniref:GNAT family N-acetyltransferase n=1 Tax=Aliivibrio fischeri TaxID=668 RepID=UPI0012D8BE81|nr:GNAT family N-acetyltransferase [Aliivibrio fischeri]MUK62968.1 GNAT family N-acetyltransferase [Aliivibrio fischeri]MUK77888.1 GNAT family N-acetyltransferase [Aliivibrio fischeri]MUL20415.1 GNAT family N-acetyltransferase [Aliivibrio fischeri]MUL24190.1 GNAT family N-acetyltransferase [Aliivibrio fischeri]